MSDTSDSGESEADRLLRMAVEAMAAEFGHDDMMQEEQPDRIDLAYRAAVAYLGRNTRGLSRE